jgi:hypothetical protein
MGLTTIELEIANVASPERTEKLEFLVDSGAIYSVVPAPAGSVWVPPVYPSPR